jgi:DNA-directed RNA polymerase specialized sigma24 family protein
MNENYTDRRVDPLLLPFLYTADEREAARHLDDLIAKAIPGIATVTKSSRMAEDAFQETTYRVVRQLWQLRAQPDGNGIANYLHYVQVVASRVVKDQVRQEHPKRRSLVDALRHVLRSDPALASWERQGHKVCGLAAWRDLEGRTESERLTRLLDEPRSLQDVVPLGCDADNVGHAHLLRRLFDWVGHPITFDHVTKIVCGFKQIENLIPLASVEFGGRSLGEWLPDTRRRPDEDAEWKEFLQQLWAEIEQLPRPHRLAYLLNFTVADGQLELFWVYGIVSLRRIGATLQIEDEEFARLWPALTLSDAEFWSAPQFAGYEERFAALWQHLPLTDANIACLLGTERQKVINLRKAARDRLSRVMARGESAKRCVAQSTVRKKKGVGRSSFSRTASSLWSAPVESGATAGC